MFKYIGFFSLLLLLSCSNQGNQGNNSFEEHKKDQKVSDYTKLIKLTSADAGWGSISNYDGMGMPEIKITLQNISSKPITDDLYLKYRFIEGDEIIGEMSQNIHYQSSDIPWDINLKKTFILSFGAFIPEAKKRNLSAQIFDANNNLLWNGKVENVLLK